MMEYKGYVGKVKIDDEAGILYGEVINIRDVITFEGASVEEAQQAFRESVDDYLLDIGENRIFNKKKTLCNHPIGVHQGSGFREHFLKPVSAQSGSESSLSVLTFQA